MSELTTGQQIKILEDVITYLESDPFIPFLCHEIPLSAFNLGFTTVFKSDFKYVNSLIPLFTPDNAFPFSKKPIEDIHESWFYYDDRIVGRINFCKWMIEQLKGGSNE